MSTSLCLYVYTFLCARNSGWTQRGLNPWEGGGGYRFEMKNHLQPEAPKPVRHETHASCIQSPRNTWPKQIQHQLAS